MQQQLQLQTPLEFHRAFLRAASGAQKSVWLQSMALDPGPFIDEMMVVIQKKAREGLDVRITIDWLCEQYFEGKFDYLPYFNVTRFTGKRAFQKRRRQLLEALSQSGCQITFTNTPHRLLAPIPQLGRNHTKMYLIDGQIGWIGGLNLLPSSFHTYDGMVQIHDQKFLTALTQHYGEVNKHRPSTNYSVQLADDYRLLFDNGTRAHSLIYDEAIASTHLAKKEIILISQLVPSGRLLSALLKKAVTLPVTFITSSPKDDLFTAFIPKILYKNFLRDIKKLPLFKIVHVDRKVHLKLLIIDQKESFFGSHNLSEVGVQLGTEEIMLHSSDAVFAASLLQLARRMGLL